MFINLNTTETIILITGTFKNILGRIMLSFVGLRAKMYACNIAGVFPTKKAKGTKRCVVKNKITLEDYITCLRDSTIKKCEQHNITSENHHLYSTSSYKVALSPFDDKRYISQDGITTLPWGHFTIIDEE